MNLHIVFVYQICMSINDNNVYGSKFTYFHLLFQLKFCPNKVLLDRLSRLKIMLMPYFTKRDSAEMNTLSGIVLRRAE